MKVLIVDDNDDNLMLMEDTLSKNGYEILTAKNGKEAIDVTNSKRPDLILLDIMMPGMDGFTACKKIHFNENNKNIPIIMVTARGEVKDLMRGLECGAIDYIKKPFNNLELSARVKSALKLKQTTDELIKEKQKTALMEMAAAVAHNLNQPLSGMILNIQYIQKMLQEEKTLPEDLNDKLDVLVSLIDNMSEMIKKIGQITRYYTTPYVKDIKIVDIDKSSL
jgi:DNA-binding response OmpR family regulator